MRRRRHVPLIPPRLLLRLLLIVTPLQSGGHDAFTSSLVPTLPVDFPSFVGHHPFLSAIAVRAAEGTQLQSGRRLEVTSVRRHNGTAMERIVNATWDCVFPRGSCTMNHAALEGLPEKAKACTKETNKGPLDVTMEIDLNCADLGKNFDCRRGVPKEPVDPFTMCNNDPHLIKALCKFECRNGGPWEVCYFRFDSDGLFNMSDETIDVCKIESECKSMYLEQNQMLCSGHHTVGNFKPHWLSSEDPWHDRANYGLSAPAANSTPADVRLPEHSFVSKSLWAIAIAVVCVAFACQAYTAGILPQNRVVDSVMFHIWGDKRDVVPSRLGSPYRAPRVELSRYSPPGMPTATSPSV
eukprot:CAMPEP_0117618218 /NCGR_PEP_ID=MMETSP0784-20121206/85992_1 /TAXON_ID=39447 /ORGANISM="" /LENGTH=352 /DNA_ID=CAMNT_0005422079 /DNA_START=1 /DNA_END=1059 /DNA_ORIENTATION=-